MKTRSTSYTRSYAPWVPASALRRLLEPEIEAVGVCTVARRMKGSQGRCERLLFAVLNERQMVGFETADEIVTHGLGDPFLWLQDEELAVVYASGLDLEHAA